MQQSLLISTFPFDLICEGSSAEGGEAHVLLPPSLSQPESPLTSFLQSKSSSFPWAISRNQRLEDEIRKEQLRVL